MAGFDWGDAISAGLAWYMNNQQGKTPNQYPVQLTPEQKRWDDLKYKMASESTPTRDFVNSTATQFLGQLGGAPPKFSFMSPEMKGQTFAGGYTPPKFDMSSALGQWWKPGPPQATHPAPGTPGSLPGNASGGTPWPTDRGVPGQAPGPGQAGPSRDPADKVDTSGRDTRPGGRNQDFPSDIDAGNFNNPNWAAPPQQQPPAASMPPPELTGTPQGNTALQTAGDWWAGFKNEHPNWASLGRSVIGAAAAAILGPLGGLGGKALDYYLTKDHVPLPPQKPLPTTGPGVQQP
jgi:hypothetical protein